MNNWNGAKFGIDRITESLNNQFEQHCIDNGLVYDFTKFDNGISYVSFDTHEAFKSWGLAPRLGCSHE